MHTKVIQTSEVTVSHGEIDDLIADVSVKNGELNRSKRFDGTGPAQPYLDIALFGLMAAAAKGSKLAKLRQEIQT